jgi:hypothetical protein
MATGKNSREQSVTLLHIGIELFFALLPLFVLGAMWLAPGGKHAGHFVSGPEWSMTACVLYGLSIAKLHLAASALPTPAAMSALSLVPLSGVIVSVIFIYNLVQGGDNVIPVGTQLVNLAIAIVTFFIIGGYGISRSSVHRHAGGE